MHYLYQNHHTEIANSVVIVETNLIQPYHLHSINLQVPEEILELYNIYVHVTVRDLIFVVLLKVCGA